MTPVRETHAAVGHPAAPAPPRVQPGASGALRQRGRRLPWILATVVQLLGAHAAEVIPPAGRSPAHDPPVYQIDTWATEHGLPENSATSMVQSPDGYLWFGTFNGLVRFDGVQFTVFDQATTPELPSPGIVELHLDQRGRLWVCTLRGIVVREGARWRSIHRADPANEEYVLTVAERSGGDLLFTLYNGRVLQFADARLSELPPPPGVARAGYQGWADEQGHWWVLQHGFLGSWTGTEWVPRLPDAAIPTPGLYAVGGGPAKDGGWWLFRDRDLRKYSRGIEVERRPLAGLDSEPVGTFSSLTEDSDGNVWICTYESGLLQVPPAGPVRRWTEKDGLSYRDVRFVFEDRERNLWVGSSGGGLMRFKPRRFRVFDHEPPGDAPRMVNSVAPAPDGGLWVATFGQGFFHLGPEGRTRRYRLPGWEPDSRFFETTLVDRRARTWVAIHNESLHVFDARGGRHLPKEQTSGHQIRALFEDSAGRVWTSGGSGISVFDDEVVRLYGSAQGVPAGSVACFEEGEDGHLWFSNLDGLFRIEEERAVEIRTPDGGPVRGVTSLKRAPGGTLWMGTLDRGLLRHRNGTLASVGVDEGLPVRGVHGIVEDDQGWFWMASNRGVVRARRTDLDEAADGRQRRLPHQILDRSDGLPSIECPNQRQPVAGRDPYGRIWFATRNGVARIDPARIRLNPVPPPVQIEQIVYHVRTIPGSGQAAPTRRVEAPFSGPVRLPAGSRHLEIHHTAPSFAAPEKVRFEVQLEGVDADWRAVEGKRVTEFQELPPGDYVYRVRAANNDGVWNETGASLAFTLLPHFWETWWFRAAAVLLLVHAGGSAAWWRSRKRVRQALERERTANELRDLAGRLINAQEDERRRIARELHDDFSQRLAMLSVEMELSDGATPRAPSPPGLPGPSGPRLSDLVSRVKELSSEVHRLAYELHPAKLDQLGLVAAARGFCRELGRKSGLRVAFEPGDFPRNIPADAALCLYRILQETLQNAARHSGAAEARVELRAEPDRLGLCVVDSGRGFDVDRARREGGLGLSSMQERVRHLAGTLEVRSEPGHGTRVEVWLPRPRTPPPA